MIDERVIVEKLDVKPGELVLVVVPTDMSHAEVACIADSFGDLGQELDALFFVVPDNLKFKVVRADEVRP